MFKLRKITLMMFLGMLAASLWTALPVMAAETSRVTFIDFTDTAAETLPMHNVNAANDGGRMKKNTDIYYGNAGQSGLWSVTGSSSTLVAYNVPSSVDLETAAKCNDFVLRFYSSTENDAFNVLFYPEENGKGSPYYQYPLYVTKSGWQEVVIPVSSIASKVPVQNIKSFILQKGGWGIKKDAENGYNSKNKLYFDSMWFESRAVTFIDFTAPDSDSDMPMYNSSANQRGKIYKDTAVHYETAKQSGRWTVPDKNSNLTPYNVPESFNYDLAATRDSFVIRLYSKEASDAFNVLFYPDAGGAGKPYYQTTLYITKSGWQEIKIPVSDIAAKVPVKNIKSFVLNKGGWGITEGVYNGNNVLYFDSMWFGSESDFNVAFEYKSSEYDGAENAGVYDTVALEFAEPLSGTIACDAVEVKRDGNSVTEFTAWSEGNTLCIKTDTAMAFNSTYEITATPMLESRRGYKLDRNITISFKTKSPYLAIDDIKLVDGDGNKLSRLPQAGSEVAAMTEIINGSNEDKGYVFIIAMFDKDNRLLEVHTSNISECGANMAVPKTYSTDQKVTITDNTASVRGYLWSGLNTMVPSKEMAHID